MSQVYLMVNFLIENKKLDSQQVPEVFLSDTVERQNLNFVVFGFQTEQNWMFGSKIAWFELLIIKTNIKRSFLLSLKS